MLKSNAEQFSPTRNSSATGGEPITGAVASPTHMYRSLKSMTGAAVITFTSSDGTTMTSFPLNAGWNPVECVSISAITLNGDTVWGMW